MASAQGRRGRGLHGTVPTHDEAAALALAHHVAGAFANTAAGDAPRHKVGLVCEGLRPQLGAAGNVFIEAVQRVLDQLVAVLEQIGTELAACARQVVQRVEVKLAGKLADDTVEGPWLAYNTGGESSPLRCRSGLTDNSSGQR